MRCGRRSESAGARKGPEVLPVHGCLPLSLAPIKAFSPHGGRAFLFDGAVGPDGTLRSHS
jgi:hypothetical protein